MALFPFFRRRFAALVVLALALLFGATALSLSQDGGEEEQKNWITNFVQDRLSTPERQIQLSNIEGALGSNVVIREITIADAEGVWLRVNNARLNWNQGALLLGRLEVRSLAADSIEYLRNAIPNDQLDLPAPEAVPFSVPEFPVAITIEELAVPRVSFGEDVFGLASEISLAGGFTLADGNLDAQLDIIRLDGPGGTLDLDVAYSNETSSIELALALVEPENGVLANLLRIDGRPAVELRLTGSGPVAGLQTQLTLVANGQTALSGGAQITQTGEGHNIDLDVRGPLAMLVAEPYRPFFGAESVLSADALVRSEGGLSISGLRLSGGQLALEASAQTTPDNFLRELVLRANIADSTGAPVTLPVPGAATTVQSAVLAVDYGVGDSEDWSSSFSVTQYATEGFAADTLAFNLGGVAANLSDPATRRLTFNGDGTLGGIAASPEVEAALGNGIGVGIAGLWNAGQPVELAELRVVGEALTAALSGTISGLDFTGDIAIETASIAPFSGLAGRELDGGLTLRATGSVMPVTGVFTLELDGTGRDLKIDDELADNLLQGEVALSGLVARTEAGLTAKEFRIANQQVQVLADGTFSSSAADFTFNLGLADLALLSPEATGALSVVGTAKGQEGVIALDLDATIPSGTLAGRPLREAALGFAGQYQDARLAGAVTGTAFVDGHRSSLGADVDVNADTQALRNIAFQTVGAEITGGLVRNVASGLIDGDLVVAAPDISVAAALALVEARGAINARAVLSGVDGKQNASVNGDVSGLRINDIQVGAADFTAEMGDLFGVPAVDGRVNASTVAAAGVTIQTLEATANQTGDTTAFDAQARLATGTDVDVAGSLAPVEGGYRLALDRAQLAQGELSARLAQPTVLQVSGNNVALQAVRFDVGSGSITATGSAGDVLDIALEVNSLPLSIANAVAPDLGLAGTLDGQARITGSGSDPQVQFTARGAGINAAAIRDYGVAPLALTAEGSFGGGVVRLGSVQANGAGGLTVSGSGSVPLAGEGLDLRLQGAAPLTLANRFVADRGAQLSGTVQLDAQVRGSLQAPQFGGSVSTSNAGYVDPELNLRLVGITGSASLSGTQLAINSLGAQLATGGTVSASGTVGLTGGFPADLRLALRSARYADGDLFVATASGDLALTGNLTGSPLLSGNLLVEEANITVPENFGGGAALVEVEHVRPPRDVAQTLARAEVTTRGGVPVPRTRPAGVVLDVNVNAPNQIFVRGRGLDAEVGGTVRLTGPLNDIQPVGAFELNRGRLSLLGQRIVFDSGIVTLVGDLDPVINFVASTEGDDITVFVTVAGRVSDVEVTFTSNPVLPQDEVLARLIFKRSMGELSPLQLARLAGAAAELMGGGGGGLVDSLRGAAGLDDLDVVTDAEGNVAVQAGTYIQDNVYLGVQAGAGGQSRVTINLDVTDDLKVTGAAGQNGESALGVYYEKDY
ncbi:translocation/assembly module TamB domain-containing protein [Devosia sp. 1566]|uniref:translocation/assembly module TamB domain-containing protein n=1 Tax=Devosia sp. 1566 TaxID=2499144 RepID=UPI000FD99012|nr:translocation/assembly module TamB domain-containing protein [Devosia sp. 1566]